MAKNKFTSVDAFAIQVFSKYFGGAQTWLYRVSGGKIGNTLVGCPVLLLTTVGRKSGKSRTAPLLFLRDGDAVVIVASKGGFPKHPAWYLNLRDNPSVRVQIGADVQTMNARTLSDEEKARVWPKLTAMYSDYQMYQDRTDRSIPVVALTRA